jgi:hypothetical protein
LFVVVPRCSDFNGTSEDEVYSMMERAGYSSSFKVLNQREVGVTHHNHRDEDVGGSSLCACVRGWVCGGCVCMVSCLLHSIAHAISLSLSGHVVDFIFMKNFTSEDISDEAIQAGKTASQEHGGVVEEVPHKWLTEHLKSIPAIEDQSGRSGGDADHRWELEPVESWVHPAGEPDEVWAHSFGETSDHRPVVSRFNVRRTTTSTHSS